MAEIDRVLLPVPAKGCRPQAFDARWRCCRSTRARLILSLGWTGFGVAEMLAASLSESPGSARGRRAARVPHARRSEARTGSYDEQVQNQLASLLNVDTLVTGRMRQAGSAVRIDLQLVRMDGGSASTRQIVAETPKATGVFELVDDLSNRLRSELDAARPIESDATTLHTSSPEATAAYLEGRGRLASR